MKNFILLLICTFPIFLTAQEPIKFSEVVECKGDQKELAQRAREWIAIAFKNNRYDTKSDTDEKIIVRSSFFYTPKKIWGGHAITEGDIEYNVVIEFKEGRYRYSIDNFVHTADKKSEALSGIITLTNSFGLLTMAQEAPKIKGTSKGWRQKVWNDIRQKTNVYTKELVSNLKTTMEKESKESDW